MKKKKISRETITEAALAILQMNGLSHVTMRNVAGELKVKAPALYWYIKNKQELLQLLAEHISSQIEFPVRMKEWEEEIILLSLEIRRALLSVPDGAEIMMNTLPISNKRLYLIDKTLEIFHRAKFPEHKIFLSVTLINTYVTSFVLDEHKQQNLLDEIGAEEVYNQFTKAITSLPRSEVPYLYDHMLSPKAKINDEESFLAGLQMILSGIKAEMENDESVF
jgi:TetR/AcrR family tetracycline transcriptional repressor